MKNVSVIIITKNEEKNLRGCLESVRWTDEIIVVDAFSSDATVAIAKEFTPAVFQKEWEGFAKQKAYALSLANNEWVLSLDADEQISPQLSEEILSLKEEDFSGYEILRENYFLKKKITTCGWDKDFQLRLFKKDKTKVTVDKLVHEGFLVDGEIKKLTFPVYHFTTASLEKMIGKINYYSSLYAVENYSRKKKITGLSILLHGVSAFLRPYFSLKGYKDGMHGLLISFLNGLTTILNYAKLWELQKNKSRKIE
ncbi:MAG: glycosyltransferase family 2 protein [Ignavibacteriaceae bacterium]|jgi:glycosyltransferase involved in cell wall biosynthesis